MLNVMRPRVVDWTLGALVTLTVGSGFGAWLLRDEVAGAVIAAHVALGVALIVPLVWKMRRVQPRVLRVRRWDGRTPFSVLALLSALASLVSGFVWTRLQVPTGYPNGMHIHIVAGLLTCGFVLAHVALRFRLPARYDWQPRRDALRWLGMAAFGAAMLPLRDALNHVLRLPGAERRFTGSRPAGDDTAHDMPVTNWLLDRPAPVDVTRWRLRVTGAVQRELVLTLDDLRNPRLTRHVRATLDCTGGWHSTQTWRGVRVDDLLDAAGALPAARYVSFVSITGYRWSLPLAEARHALLATGYGDQDLTHWHGAPLRLVAPGRRGFMWVKWVREVRLLESPDFGQWAAIFLSGLSDQP